MSPSEALIARALALSPGTRQIRQLPLYADPLPEEALVSWLLRLAARFGISMQTLEQAALGLDCRGFRMQWWRRPHISLLKRIGDATGVRIERLRQMTLHDWHAHEDDEESDRFNERHFSAWRPARRDFRFAACEQCVKAEKIPYIRLIWTIGWVAICPTHGTVMTTACQRCRGKLRLARHDSAIAFSPVVCSVCREAVEFTDFRADPIVMRLQELLLRGKRAAATGEGGFSWVEAVDFWDSLAGTFRRTWPLSERRKLHEKFVDELGANYQATSSRYTDLAFLGWLTGLYPKSSGAQVGLQLLATRRGSSSRDFATYAEASRTPNLGVGPSGPPLKMFSAGLDS